MWRPTRTLRAKKHFVKIQPKVSIGKKGRPTDCIFTICGQCRTYGHIWGGVPFQCRSATRARARVARTRERDD